MNKEKIQRNKIADPRLKENSQTSVPKNEENG